MSWWIDVVVLIVMMELWIILNDNCHILNFSKFKQIINTDWLKLLNSVLLDDIKEQ